MRVLATLSAGQPAARQKSERTAGVHPSAITTGGANCPAWQERHCCAPQLYALRRASAFVESTRLQTRPWHKVTRGAASSCDTQCAHGHRLSAADHPRRALPAPRPRDFPRHSPPPEKLGRLRARSARPRYDPGALIVWVTTPHFLEVFALGSLDDLPDLETLAAAGAREGDDDVGAALDAALGLMEAEGRRRGDSPFDETEVEA